MYSSVKLFILRCLEPQLEIFDDKDNYIMVKGCTEGKTHCPKNNLNLWNAKLKKFVNIKKLEPISSVADPDLWNLNNSLDPDLDPYQKLAGWKTMFIHFWLGNWSYTEHGQLRWNKAGCLTSLGSVKDNYLGLKPCNNSLEDQRWDVVKDN